MTGEDLSSNAINAVLSTIAPFMIFAPRSWPSSGMQTEAQGRPPSRRRYGTLQGDLAWLILSGWSGKERVCAGAVDVRSTDMAIVVDAKASASGDGGVGLLPAS